MAQFNLIIPDGRRVAGLAWARAFINANSPPDPNANPNQAPYATADAGSPTGFSYATDLAYLNWVCDNACTSYANAASLPADGEG
jgi:hypothetical protein